MAKRKTVELLQIFICVLFYSSAGVTGLCTPMVGCLVNGEWGSTVEETVVAY
jgi:hypothetical protein